MYKLSITLFILVILSACGGGGGGGNNTPSNNSTSNVINTVSGTAATGVSLEGIVNIYGSQGGIVASVPIDNDGHYSADVTGLTPPYLLYAEPDNAALASQYSFAAGPGTANITPLTTLALFYAYNGSDPAPLINTWPVDANAIATNLPDAQATVNANFVNVFTVINAALNTDFTTYDYFTSSFNIGDIIDQILDLLNIDLISGTPVIKINGHAFNFDPDIDTSDINIGGSIGNSSGPGRLSITGNDASALGNSFTPTVQTGSAGNIVALVWGNVSTQISAGGANGQLSVITFNFVRIINHRPVVYSYGQLCEQPGIDCSKLQLNIAGRQAHFNNLQLPPSGAATNSASGPIILNGTLNWNNTP
jgi:hypothetical protein